MCLGIPGQILALPDDRPHVAVVDVAGARREVNTGLFEGEGLRTGEWILIHMGFVLERLDEAEALHAQRMLEGDPAYIDELLAERGRENRA